MPSFTYKALKKEDNSSYEATVEAKDRFEVYNIVRKEGGQVVSVKEAGGSSDLMNRINAKLGRVKITEKIMFMRNLGAMIDAGLTITRSLNVMQRQSRNEKLQSVLKSIQTDIEKGGDLHSALTKHPHVFSQLMVAMVKAGEESGSLSDSCRLIADQTERTYELKKKVRGAMIYPSVILTVLLGVGILMMLFIVPSIAETFDALGSELPATTQIVILISDLLVDYTLLVLGGLIACLALFIAFVRTPFGKHATESFVLHIPVIGELVKETNSARTGRTLSSLLGAGVHVIQGIQITGEVIQNLHYREIITEARKKVETGAPIAEVFLAHEKLYPPLVGELISVGEETGNLPNMLAEVATFYEKQVDQKTKNMSTIIEPLLMLVVGVGVGFFAVAMLSPIYSVVENF